MQITGAGDIVDGASGAGRGDGRGTVTFSRAPSSTNSLNISHVITSGQPNGTIYRICVDAPVEKIEVTLVPAPANDKYLITATLAMPSISAPIKPSHWDLIRCLSLNGRRQKLVQTYPLP